MIRCGWMSSNSILSVRITDGAMARKLSDCFVTRCNGVERHLVEVKFWLAVCGILMGYRLCKAEIVRW